MSPKEPEKSQIDSIIALFSSGKLQDALDSVEHLLKSFPEDSLLHNITGACYAGLGQLGSAVKRNKIKRKLRNITNEAVKRLSLKFDYSYLIIAKEDILENKYVDVTKIMFSEFNSVR